MASVSRLPEVPEEVRTPFDVEAVLAGRPTKSVPPLTRVSAPRFSISAFVLLLVRTISEPPVPMKVPATACELVVVLPVSVRRPLPAPMLNSWSAV